MPEREVGIGRHALDLEHLGAKLEFNVTDSIRGFFRGYILA